jgi:hypothetical protein
MILSPTVILDKIIIEVEGGKDKERNRTVSILFVRENLLLISIIYTDMRNIVTLM